MIKWQQKTLTLAVSSNMLSKTDISKFNNKFLAHSSDKESDKGSSSDGDSSALESAKGSGSNSNDLPPFSTLQDNPEGTEQKWGDLPEESAESDDLITIEDEENKDEESAKGAV